MKKAAFVAIIALAMGSGCTTVTKTKGVTVEYDGQGRQVRRVETETASQTEQSTQKLRLKHIEL